MDHPGFFDRAGPYSLAEVAETVGAKIVGDGDAKTSITDVLPLDTAGPATMTFLDNKKYLPNVAGTDAAACLIIPELADRLPSSTIALVMKAPYHGFARALAMFYPQAARPLTAGLHDDGPIHPTAQIEDGAEIEAGAVIGPQAQIGRGARIAACAVIGRRVSIGRETYIGPNASVTHALIGDRVILHAGVRIGQDGFGFAMGPQGHLKVPQIGRVIIQDDVEIGANSAIDRGALKDTIIGQGSKIDNLVQIGHNVVMGRNCVIVAQTGISGSTELGDFVVMGGQSGSVGHVKIGMGAQIAGASHVKNNIEAGARVGGTPARPFRQWAREMAFLSRAVSQSKKKT
ncbi:MAG: UDP-3-O-(3-hydroxymyristoyl)glucosamine N-acyltransferase [Hyphomicrobiaceae bacterium]